MDQSSFIRAQQFKSPLSVVAGMLLCSRETQAKRAKNRTQEIRRLKQIHQQHERTLSRAEEQLAQMRSQITQLKAENERLRQQPAALPDDPPLPSHGFGPKMISLCVNLARKIGLRPAAATLRIIFDWLGVTEKLPEWTTIRTWMLRVGVAAIEQPIEQADDWIWMADHSNQIGPEKALAVVGLRASEMPPPGVALTHQDVRVLLIEPGVSWKREDMAQAYEKLAEQSGCPPMAVLVDGAVELREGAQTLQKRRENMAILGDFKHYAANVLKKLVGGDERFAEFGTLIGHTRSAIQQTELAHLTPPSPKPKSRFMNLAATLKWAEMALWQLANPRSKGRRGITAQRMNDKLGWLRKFRDDIRCWNACQNVVSESITFINEQGLFKGAADQLSDCMEPLRRDETSSKVADRLLDFIRQSESKLDEGQRLPMSTEILESSFGLFKQLERQHSKGGFTSLLAAFGSLLRPSTPETIRRDFAQVSVKQMRSWVTKNLGKTLASKRQTAYQEFAHAA